MIEADNAVDYIQELLNANNLRMLEEAPKEPDPAAIHFLLETGHKVTAIRYYRHCTGTQISVAQKAIDNFYTYR